MQVRNIFEVDFCVNFRSCFFSPVSSRQEKYHLSWGESGKGVWKCTDGMELTYHEIFFSIWGSGDWVYLRRTSWLNPGHLEFPPCPHRVAAIHRAGSREIWMGEAAKVSGDPALVRGHLEVPGVLGQLHGCYWKHSSNLCSWSLCYKVYIINYW